MGIQGVARVTGGYKGLQGVTRGYRGLQGVTGGHLSSCRSRGWGFVRVRVAPGWGICQFFLKRLKSFLFNV